MGRITEHPNLTSVVYHGCKATNKQLSKKPILFDNLCHTFFPEESVQMMRQ